MAGTSIKKVNLLSSYKFPYKKKIDFILTGDDFDQQQKLTNVIIKTKLNTLDRNSVYGLICNLGPEGDIVAFAGYVKLNRVQGVDYYIDQATMQEPEDGGVFLTTTGTFVSTDLSSYFDINSSLYILNTLGLYVIDKMVNDNYSITPMVKIVKDTNITQYDRIPLFHSGSVNLKNPGITLNTTGNDHSIGTVDYLKTLFPGRTWGNTFSNNSKTIILGSPNSVNVSSSSYEIYDTTGSLPSDTTKAIPNYATIKNQFASLNSVGATLIADRLILGNGSQSIKTSNYQIYTSSGSRPSIGAQSIPNYNVIKSQFVSVETVSDTLSSGQFIIGDGGKNIKSSTYSVFTGSIDGIPSGSESNYIPTVAQLQDRIQGFVQAVDAMSFKGVLPNTANGTSTLSVLVPGVTSTTPILGAMFRFANTGYIKYASGGEDDHVQSGDMIIYTKTGSLGQSYSYAKGDWSIVQVNLTNYAYIDQDVTADRLVITKLIGSANAAKPLKTVDKLPYNLTLTVANSTHSGVIGYKGNTASANAFYSITDSTATIESGNKLAYGGDFSANKLYSNKKQVMSDVGSNMPLKLSSSNGTLSVGYNSSTTLDKSLINKDDNNIIPTISTSYYSGALGNINRGVVLNSVMHLGGLAVYSNADSLSNQDKIILEGLEQYITPTVITNIYYDDDLDQFEFTIAKYSAT